MPWSEFKDLGLQVAAAPGAGHDRAAAFSDGDSVVLVIADGAGGLSGGAEAAQEVVDLTLTIVRRDPLRDPTFWARALATIDDTVSSNPVAGETTAIIIEVTADLVFGASVGNSQAWVLDSGDGGDVALTSDQRRRPMIGAGDAHPTALSAPRRGTLLMATDGLFDALAPNVILDHARGDDIGALIELARNPRGELYDDVAVIRFAL